MSKRKIDETMTKARNARAKKAREAKGEEPPAETATKPRKTRPMAIAPGDANETAPAEELQPTAAKHGKGKAQPKENREDLVVFAFRLSQAERDLIHKAAGPAKASKYVRTLAVAAASGDENAVKEILQGVPSNGV